MCFITHSLIKGDTVYLYKNHKFTVDLRLMYLNFYVFSYIYVNTFQVFEVKGRPEALVLSIKHFQLLCEIHNVNKSVSDERENLIEH